MESKPGDIGSPKGDDILDQQTAAPSSKANEETIAPTAVETAAADADSGNVGDVPDPDEDDLDDLDGKYHHHHFFHSFLSVLREANTLATITDLLDEFSAVNVEAEKQKLPSGPGRPAAVEDPTPALGADVFSDEDFAKQLQDGMADLLGEIESSPEMHAQFESIFKELGAVAAAADPTTATTAGASTSTPSATGAAASASAAEASFQETIKRTMERMQTSGEQATAAAAAEGTDDFMAELLKQMQAGGGGLDGEGNEEELSKMLLGMMDQLTNKEILYEPMKELNEKFPGWLVKNRATTSADDLKRYEEQQVLVKEIVDRFELHTYSDDNKVDREYIVDRMQKMQAAGSPPDDLVGDMPSAQDALSMPDESCNPQ
ncbi:Pex19 protein family-domain-containing protein [Cercophora scortea]|uniref:Pex19 protein family-domain-containing protein n=1 Tax=Cercophora scortea TaxID=314031 RepID=A0AAE0MDA6_9PEZI|nr:Pex19 protein family-domain-containing protein [Cercophora scortea]